jgi:CubicO group peptidase (beta-lactamase class C family)
LRHCVWVALTASVALALSACGGGGGGGGGGGQQQTNVAPTVQAGSDQTITLPTNSVQLQGSATDDGLPTGSTLAYTWSASGSGVTFGSTSTASTSATFAAAGTYTLTLSASDGALSGSDTVTITVEGAANAAPVVQAGADQTIELPATAALQGSATDDGAASALTYSWAANPATGVTFDNAAAAATTAHFTTAGAYTLTLTVNDGTQDGTDSLAVTVNAAVYPAADDDATDDHGWTRVAAADVGMTQSLLDQAATYAQSSPVGPGSGIVVRHGRIVHSWGDIDTRYDLKSTTKSIGGLALGLALDDGKLALSDLAKTHLSNVGLDPNDATKNTSNDWRDHITVQQLATHTAGFEKSAGYGVLLYEPGTTWSYSDGGLNWLADLLTNVYTQDLNVLMNSRVWTVLGIDGATQASTDLRWRDNQMRLDLRPDGIPRRELASGILTNVNTMARVGLLMLRNGVWANNQRIVSQSFVDTVRVPVAANAGLALPDAANFPGATTNYGVLWWTNATHQLANVPTDAYWAWGLGDSLIVVIPSLDIVIARAGNQNLTVTPGVREWNDQDWNGDYTVLAPFFDPIVQSVTQ